MCKQKSLAMQGPRWFQVLAIRLNLLEVKWMNLKETFWADTGTGVSRVTGSIRNRDIATCTVLLGYVLNQCIQNMHWGKGIGMQKLGIGTGIEFSSSFRVVNVRKIIATNPRRRILIGGLVGVNHPPKWQNHLGIRNCSHSLSFLIRMIS